MKKININLIPLNAFFTVTDFMKAERTEAEAKTDRYVYFKDPELSWFEMKSNTAQAFLAHQFQGVKTGDNIKFSFDVNVISNYSSLNSIKMQIYGYTLVSDTVTNLKEYTIERRYLNNQSFKHIDYEEVLSMNLSSYDGIVINIRVVNQSGTAVTAILKNINIELETSNDLIEKNESKVSYNYKTDFLNLINNLSKNKLKSPIASELKELYEDGKVTFADNYSMSISTPNSNKNKMILALLPLHELLKTNVSVYSEYTTDVAVGNFYTTYNLDGSANSEVNGGGFGITATKRKQLTQVRLGSALKMIYTQISIRGASANITWGRTIFYVFNNGVGKFKIEANDIIELFGITQKSGTTANRPLAQDTGDTYFDTTLGLPIWWNGTKWIKSDGTDA